MLTARHRVAAQRFRPCSRTTDRAESIQNWGEADQDVLQPGRKAMVGGRLADAAVPGPPLDHLGRASVAVHSNTWPLSSLSGGNVRRPVPGLRSNRVLACRGSEHALPRSWRRVELGVGQTPQQRVCMLKSLASDTIKGREILRMVRCFTGRRRAMPARPKWVLGARRN